MKDPPHSFAVEAGTWTFYAGKEANARLIWKAPELLAICQEIADDSKVDLVDSARRIRLYSALAKCKGGE